MDFERILPQAAAQLRELSVLRPLAPRDLKSVGPWLHRQIVRDSKCPALLNLWGQSINHDEHAGLTIVEPAILQTIGQIAGIPMTGPIVHAGLQHTYGEEKGSGKAPG